MNNNIEETTIIGSFYPPKHYKSKMIIGDNFSVMTTKHFNKFQKFMFKICFGIKIEDVNITR